jgi:hypothetical protein
LIHMSVSVVPRTGPAALQKQKPLLPDKHQVMTLSELRQMPPPLQSTRWKTTQQMLSTAAILPRRWSAGRWRMPHHE